MRSTDRPEQAPALGPVKRKPMKPADPVRVRDGIMRGADGKLYTDKPPAS